MKEKAVTMIILHNAGEYKVALFHRHRACETDFVNVCNCKCKYKRNNRIVCGDNTNLTGRSVLPSSGGFLNCNFYQYFRDKTV